MSQYSLLDPRNLSFSEHVHNQLVKRSHRLIESPNQRSMSLNEQRLLAYALSKLPESCEPSSLVVRVTGVEFGAAFGMCSAQRYRDLYEAFDGLLEHRIEWDVPAKGRRKARRAWANIIVTGSRPKDLSVTEKRDGYVELKFNEDLVPDLLSKSRFILYRLGETCVLSRSLAYRLYDIGRQLLPFDTANVGSRGCKWDLEEFRHLLGMSEVYTDGFAEFSKSALRPAVEEINTKTFGLYLTYAPVRRGKRTVGIQLVARRKTPAEMEAVREWRARHKLANNLSLERCGTRTVMSSRSDSMAA